MMENKEMIEKLQRLQTTSENLRSTEDLIQKQKELTEEYNSLVEEFKQAYVGKAFLKYRESIYIIDIVGTDICYLKFETGFTEPSYNEYLGAYSRKMSLKGFITADYEEIPVLQFMRQLNGHILAVTREVCGYYGLIKTK